MFSKIINIHKSNKISITQIEYDIIHRGETGWANALVSPFKMADVGSGG